MPNIADCVTVAYTMATINHLHIPGTGFGVGNGVVTDEGDIVNRGIRNLQVKSSGNGSYTDIQFSIGQTGGDTKLAHS
jgi:hypothetical protein